MLHLIFGLSQMLPMLTHKSFLPLIDYKQLHVIQFFSDHPKHTVKYGRDSNSCQLHWPANGLKAPLILGLVNTYFNHHPPCTLTSSEKSFLKLRYESQFVKIQQRRGSDCTPLPAAVGSNRGSGVSDVARLIISTRIVNKSIRSWFQRCWKNQLYSSSVMALPKTCCL